MSTLRRDDRLPCILFLSCMGAAPRFFLQLSDDFRRRYRLVPYLQNNIAKLPDLFRSLDRELERDAVLIYHPADCMRLGKYREEYDQWISDIPEYVAKIEIPQPRFYMF